MNTYDKPTDKHALVLSLHFYDPTPGARGASHDKFWHVYIWDTGSGYTVHRHWGRDGTAGQSNDESFTTWDAAHKRFARLVSEKIGKGYVMRSSVEVPVQSTWQMEYAIETHLATAPTPKAPGRSMVIAEETDLLDLLTGKQR